MSPSAQAAADAAEQQRTSGGPHGDERGSASPDRADSTSTPPNVLASGPSQAAPSVSHSVPVPPRGVHRPARSADIATPVADFETPQRSATMSTTAAVASSAVSAVSTVTPLPSGNESLIVPTAAAIAAQADADAMLRLQYESGLKQRPAVRQLPSRAVQRAAAAAKVAATVADIEKSA
jgi:hypothetical protein